MSASGTTTPTPSSSRRGIERLPPAVPGGPSRPSDANLELVTGSDAPTPEFKLHALALIEEWERTALSAPPPGCEGFEAGFLRVYIHPQSAEAHLNVAVVVGAPDSVADARRDVETLIGIFGDHGRDPNIEFSGARHPELSGLLESLGVPRLESHPLMACGPGMLTPVEAPGVAVRLLTATDPDADLAAFATIRGTDGQMSPPAEERHVSALREALAAGRGRYALATLDGEVAGTAVLHDTRGLGEIVGVVTREPARRRRVASAATAFLTGDHLARGGRLAFLDAVDGRARSVYAGIGFKHLGEWLVHGRPA